MTRVPVALPAFPWDSLAPAKAKAAAHPGGLIDLSVGTPVDPTPEIAEVALRGNSQAPGYPQTWGTAELRSSIIGYLCRRWHATRLNERQVLPTVGSKELVAWLPTLLGIGAGDVVVIPTLAYPTYDIGARIAGAKVVPCDDPTRMAQFRPSLIWINSPANPHGAILTTELTRAWVQAARAVGAILVSDECYGEFVWEGESVSVLQESVNGGSLRGLIAVHSLSKRSNMAGYRAGYLAGDEEIVQELLEIRKHAGMMVPWPVQAAMKAVLDDDCQTRIQRERYAHRRAILRPALAAAGLRVEHSQGSLYLWVTQGVDCWQTIDFLAERGILAAPGSFYTSQGSAFVRIALTAADAQIEAAAARLRG
ncbi:MAG: succinyldiaminopimelate transaminase [Propionibacteriaceae bacterium]|jgi:succinyldiaminopimelate transaminase|nr:succinyldiaminopimelate transaminase [Propionibacteriaceae bacterium]